MVKVLVRSPHHAAELAALVRDRLKTDPLVAETPDACLPALVDSDIFFCQPSQITPGIIEAMARSPRLRWLQVLGSGLDKLASFDRPGLIVTNAAEAYGSAVAEHAVALALALLRRVPDLLAAQAARSWIKAELDTRLDSLEGGRTTVVGFGAIGQEIARRLTAFGAQVTAVRRRQGRPADDAGDIRFLPLDDALRGADLVFLAAPLTPDTRGMIDERRLGLLAPGARLVNISRGPLVVTEALLAALERGSLAGAALDVFATEPLEGASALWSAPNLIVSPHVAGRGNRLVTRRMIALCERNLAAFAAGTLGVQARA